MSVLGCGSAEVIRFRKLKVRRCFLAPAAPSAAPHLETSPPKSPHAKTPALPHVRTPGPMTHCCPQTSAPRASPGHRSRCQQVPIRRACWAGTAAWQPLAATAEPHRAWLANVTAGHARPTRLLLCSPNVFPCEPAEASLSRSRGIRAAGPTAPYRGAAALPRRRRHSS